MNEKLIPFDFASQRIVRVEVSSPGRTRAGRSYYAVHSVTVVDLVNVSPTKH